METLARAANRGSVSTGYDIDNSLKFEEDNLELLYKTFSGEGTGAGRTFTISTWCKRTELDGIDIVFGFGRDSLDYGDGGFRLNSNQLQLVSFPYSGGVDSYNIRSTAVFRDTSAWYHFMAAVDTTQGTASNRVRLYVNGTEITDFTTSDYPAQNFQWKVGRAEEHMIGNRPDTSATEGAGFSTQNFSGYITEFHFVDGQQLAPTDFGEFDTNTGIWKPKAYTGTYGTNGFYLDFENSASLGADGSGNSNNFTLSNITSADQALDTPTNNFCTLNPLITYGKPTTITEGATVAADNSAGLGGAAGTVAVNKGKWYWEVQSNAGNTIIGVQDIDANTSSTNDAHQIAYSMGNYLLQEYNYATDPTSRNDGSISGYVHANSNWYGIALDMDNNQITYYKNGTALTPTFSLDGLSDLYLRPFSSSSGTVYFNFGAFYFDGIASSNSDANGYGSFEYGVPSGYYALCSKNLAEFG